MVFEPQVGSASLSIRPSSVVAPRFRAFTHSGGGERVGAMFALVALFVDESSAGDAITVGMQAGMGSLTHVRSVMVR